MQNLDKTLKVAITHGDINGIGYELIFRLFEETEILELFTPIVYGSAKVAAFHANALQTNCKYNVISDARDAVEGHLNILSVINPETNVELGVASVESSAAARQAVECAMKDYTKGLFDVLVIAPTSEDEMLAIRESLLSVGGDDNTMNIMPIDVLVSDSINMASVAGNVPLESVATYISEEDIVERATLLRNTLRRDLRVDIPCISVLALDETATGEKETSVVEPAIDVLASAGVEAFGPYDAEDFFEKAMWQNFDAVLAMYNDQYLRYFKQLFGDDGVLLHAGLPLVVTASLQGPSFEIAGKGVADESYLRRAIYTAIDVYRNRFYYDQPMANPLPKMYHERREDGERVRFAVRKKEGDADKRETKPAEA